MTESSSGDARGQTDTPWVESSDDLFEAAVVGVTSAETETPWMEDIKHFHAAHQQAVERFLEAVANPSKEYLEKANEAILIAKKNSDLLFEKGFYWDYRAPAPTGGEKTDEIATLPLRSAVAAMARAIEELDAKLKELIPLKIARDAYSVEDIDTIIKDVTGPGEEKDALEPLAKLTKQYAILSGELQEALKAPSITKAKSSGIGGPISKKMGVERMKELKDLGLAGAVLLGATVLGNILSRPKK